MSRIVCISDTHQKHRKLSVPDGDILIHAGDFCSGRGDLAQVQEFADWLGELPHKHKVVVAGNHDFSLFDHPVFHPAMAEAMILRHAHYLRDSSVTIEGFKIYGSPWQPAYGCWAFNLPRDGDEIREKWAAIPDDTDVLVTHGPPAGILDKTSRGDNAGCKLLRERVEMLPNLRLHVFGHIHEAGGYACDEIAEGVSDAVFINAAMLDESYRLHGMTGWIWESGIEGL